MLNDKFLLKIDSDLAAIRDVEQALAALGITTQPTRITEWVVEQGKAAKITEKFGLYILPEAPEAGQPEKS